jgi:hypothetical protein
VAKGRFGAVESEGEVCGFFALQKREEHQEKAVDSARLFAEFRAQRRFGEGKIGPIDLRRAVNQEKFAFHTMP